MDILLLALMCCSVHRGVSRIFERGGPVSLGSLKNQILKGGGSNGLMGGVQYISLTRTTNLAYFLDAKEWTNMYFEPLISVKCCPKLHIKQLRNNLHYICLWDRVVWEGGHKWKRGGPGKGVVRTPWPPHLWTRLWCKLHQNCFVFIKYKLIIGLYLSYITRTTWTY